MMLFANHGNRRSDRLVRSTIPPSVALPRREEMSCGIVWQVARAKRRPPRSPHLRPLSPEKSGDTRGDVVGSVRQRVWVSLALPVLGLTVYGPCSLVVSRYAKFQRCRR